MSATEPTIICPKCKTEIKLTESLAAPLVESICHEYEDGTLKFIFNPIHKSLRMN